MAWMQTLHHLLNPAKVERIAASLAAQNRMQVWDRVIDEGIGMRPAELRGYIRARSARIVRHAVEDYVVTQRITSEQVRNRLEALTKDAIIRRVSADLQSYIERTERQAA